MIADMINNKNLNPVITYLFIRGRKLNMCLAFVYMIKKCVKSSLITFGTSKYDCVSYFEVLKVIRLNSAHFLSWELQIKMNFNKLH